MDYRHKPLHRGPFCEPIDIDSSDRRDVDRLGTDGDGGLLRWLTAPRRPRRRGGAKQRSRAVCRADRALIRTRTWHQQDMIGPGADGSDVLAPDVHAPMTGPVHQAQLNCDQQ
jgi:hypothetical protein